jgi:hypothetical protein
MAMPGRLQFLYNPYRRYYTLTALLGVGYPEVSSHLRLFPQGL